jgi:hypothetical protein
MIVRPKRGSRLTNLYVGVLLLVLVGVGSVYSGNILGSNPNSRVEFGAGQYFLKSCNAWISLNLLEGATGTHGAPAGFSPLTGVEISGLNSTKCAGTRLLVSSESKSGEQIPLLHTDGLDSMCTIGGCPSGMTAEDSFSLTISQSGEVTLDNQDQSRSLLYDRKNNLYQVLFTHPASLASQVQDFIIQSESL